MFKLCLKILLSLSIFYSASSSAQDIIWDLGAGVAAFNLDLYPGSADKKNYVVPLPYFTLLAEKLEIGDGIRGFLFQSDWVKLDVSGDFGVPVDSDDSSARAGMPDLDTLLQVGPSLEFILGKLNGNRSEVRFELPVRAMIATDVQNVNHEGWMVEPRFVIEKRRLYKSGLSMKFTLGLKYATRDFHTYYYDVAPTYATLTRPAYASEKGYGGSFAKLVAGWREGDFIWWTMLNYQNLNGAVFEDSPLVEQKDYYFFGVGLAWVFAQNL